MVRAVVNWFYLLLHKEAIITLFVEMYFRPLSPQSRALLKWINRCAIRSTWSTLGGHREFLDKHLIAPQPPNGPFWSVALLERGKYNYTNSNPYVCHYLGDVHPCLTAIKSFWFASVLHACYSGEMSSSTSRREAKQLNKKGRRNTSSLTMTCTLILSTIDPAFGGHGKWNNQNWMIHDGILFDRSVDAETGFRENKITGTH